MERTKKIAFIKMHDIWFNKSTYLTSNATICALHTNEVLDKSMYDFRLDTKTFLLDISKDPENLFVGKKFGPVRHAINKAIKDGIKVRRVETEEEIDQYLTFQKQFCAKKGIPVLSKEEMKELNCYYAISAEGEYLGACAFLEDEGGQLFRYKYGATKHKMYANEILFWHAICEYHARGFTYFDFGGVIPTDDKESYYYRHYQFKKKFGGQLIDSYTYFKIKGGYKVFYYVFLLFVKVFFKGDVNGFTNWLNQKKILK